MTFELPRTLTLPESRARVTLRRTSIGAVSPARRGASSPLFSEVLALFDDREVALVREKADVDVRDLSLADFHVIRAFLIKAGLVHEDEIEIDCHNFGELLRVLPCQTLETGPWEDDELVDPELDHTAELGVPLPIAPVRLGRVRQATTVTLAPRTVRQTTPLWAALARDPIEIDTALVEAMGVVALGPLSAPAAIEGALADESSNAFDEVADAFLAAHYPLRLGADVFCPKCKARNTVDAPAERELAPADRASTPPDAEPAASPHPPLPALDEFVELAHAIAEPLIAEIPGDKAVLVVDDGTPAVDDGGEPLLGSYVPPPPPGALAPVRPPTVTVYYQTFVRIEREEGPFDWEAELHETIEHELEHHVFYLRGDDPMDEEERAEIDREVVRVIGRGEATRRTLAVFGRSLPDFVRRTWPLFVIGALALAISLAEARCD